MAIISRSEFFNQLANGVKWQAAVAFERKNPLPLDDSSIFQSLEAANTYAKSATAYPGQIVTVVSDDGINSYFGITQNGELEKLGSGAEADNKSIQLVDGSTLSLKDFGVQYYAYIPGTGENAGSWATTPTTGFKSGLEPKVREISAGNYELAWYEPATDTTAGLQSAVANLQVDVTNLQAAVENVPEWETIS